jgi:hypothetical protein
MFSGIYKAIVFAGSPWEAWPPPPTEAPASKDGEGLLHQPLINKTNFLLALLTAIVFGVSGMARTSNRGSSNKVSVCERIGHHVAQSLSKLLSLSLMMDGTDMARKKCGNCSLFVSTWVPTVR